MLLTWLNQVRNQKKKKIKIKLAKKQQSPTAEASCNLLLPVVCSARRPQGCVFNKHIRLLTFLTPTQLARGLQTSWSTSKASFFSVIKFHLKTLQKLPTAAVTAAKCSFFYFSKTNKVFFLRWKGEGGLEFPALGQQELSVGLVPFHREPGRPGPAH